MSANKKIKKRYIDYPPNVPKRLFRLLKLCDFNRSTLAKMINTNSGYLSQLLNKGVEPTDTTPTGRAARRALFLLVRKHHNFNQVVIHKPKIDKPQYIKDWNHLPTEERRKAIQEYMAWKNPGKYK